LLLLLTVVFVLHGIINGYRASTLPTPCRQAGIAAGEKRAGINVKSFAAGIYFVRMVDEKEQMVRKVVVGR
jgi:hypothetical protein